MLPRTPITRPLPATTSNNYNNIGHNLLRFPPNSASSSIIPTTSAIDDLLDLTGSIHNSTVNNNNNIPVNNMIGNPTAHVNSASSITVLPNAIAQLQTESAALQAARQELSLTGTISRSSNTLPISLNSGTAIQSRNNLSFPNRCISSTLMPRELFPTATVSQAANPLTSGHLAPQSYVQSSQASSVSSTVQQVPAQEPYAQQTVPLPTHTLPSYMDTQPLPSNTMSAHTQPSTFYHTYTVPTGYTSAMSFNFTYLYEISRLVKSWNISFPPRNRASSFDARKYIKTIEQRMRSYDISFENFPTVITNTLNGNVLEWYYQNENLFINWEAFKNHFKIWQTQQTDEDLLQEIYLAKQGNDENGVSFVNRMQGAFMQLEEPLPQAKQIRIIIARFNSCFLQKFAGENISNYAELFTRVSAWQATANALNSNSNVSNKQRTRSSVDHCIQESPDFDSINIITTAHPHASQNEKPSSNKNNYSNCHRNARQSDNRVNDSNLELPALLNNFESFMNSFLERLERITSSNSSANTPSAQQTSVKNTTVCGRCGRIGHVSDLCCAPTTDKLRIKAGLKVRQKSTKNFDNQANVKYTDKTDGDVQDTRVGDLIESASPINKVTSNSETLNCHQVTKINKSNNTKTPKIKTKHQKAHTAIEKIKTTQSVAPKLYSQSSTHSAAFRNDTVEPSGKSSSATLKAPSRISQMITNIFIGQHKIDALLDSGSGRSYISEAAYERIKENQLHELIPGPMDAREVIMANSKPTQTRGGAPFRINLDGYDIITWLTVVPGLSTPVILGLDFWQLADIQVNSKENTWKINSSEITHTFSSRTRQFNSASLNSLSSTEEATDNRNLLLIQQ